MSSTMSTLLIDVTPTWADRGSCDLEDAGPGFVQGLFKLADLFGDDFDRGSFQLDAARNSSESRRSEIAGHTLQTVRGIVGCLQITRGDRGLDLTQTFGTFIRNACERGPKIA